MSERDDLILNGKLPEVIKNDGYEFNEYTILTKDGYLLTTFRIWNPNKINFSKLPVFMAHGLYTDCEFWLFNTKENNLPYLLADEGYDVWLLNQRGTVYSSDHISLDNETDTRFWRFSWHHVGVYDIPANIDFILKETKHEKLYYIGYSQGSTEYFVTMSERPEFNHKIKLGIIMAPSVFMEDFNQTVLKPLVRGSVLLQILSTVYPGLHLQNNLFLKISRYLRTNTTWQNVFISVYKLVLDSGDVEEDILQKCVTRYPHSFFLMSILHYVQLIKTGKFRQFDYGFAKNLKKYGTNSPPSYDLNKVTSPVALFFSPADRMAPAKGVEQLAKALPNVKIIRYLRQFPYGHLEFLHGRHIKERLFDDVIRVIKSL